MNKRSFLFTLLLFASGQSFAQVSADIEKADFDRLLEDQKVHNAWQDIKSLESKKEVKSQDATAVYAKYAQALQNLDLEADSKLYAVRQQELQAIERISK